MSVWHQTKLQEAKEYWQDKWQKKNTLRDIRHELENIKEQRKKSWNTSDKEKNTLSTEEQR